MNFAVQIAGSLNPNVSTATLTSYCQMQRFNLLAAIGMSASQPVLKAAFVLRNDAPTIENLGNYIAKCRSAEAPRPSAKH